MTPEPGRVVVTRVQRQPGDRVTTRRVQSASRTVLPYPAGRRPVSALAPGPHRAVSSAAAVTPGQGAARACTAWWPAGHRALCPSPTIQPSLTCTVLRLRDPPHCHRKDHREPACRLPTAATIRPFHCPDRPDSPTSPWLRPQTTAARGTPSLTALIGHRAWWPGHASERPRVNDPGPGPGPATSAAPPGLPGTNHRSLREQEKIERWSRTQGCADVPASSTTACRWCCWPTG